MKKSFPILVLLLVVVFSLPAPASAVTSAGIKPGSFFYFFDTTFENISLFFTFNPEQKAQKALEYADERLAEIESVAEEKNPNAVKTAIANYESNVALATEKSKEVKDKGQAETLLNSIVDNNSRNQEVLAAILIKVPEEAKEAITQAIEASRKGQEEATKQIAELKGEIEKLKNEVAELKQEKDNQQASEIEKLQNEVSELKKKPAQPQNQQKQSLPPAATNNVEHQKTTISPSANIAPPNTISCNGKYWTPCPAGQRFYCPSTGDAQCLIDNVFNQNNQDNSTQNQQQEEAARQAELQMLQKEQNKTNQVNSLLAEYQQKINEIDAQILAVNQKYYKDTENLRQEGISASGIAGRKIELAREANRQIELLQLEQESLRIQYLNKINSIQ